MVIKETRIIKYELENPHFNGVEFGELSKSFLPMDYAVCFAANQGRILWSAREAGAFSIEQSIEQASCGFRYLGCPIYLTRTVDIGIKIDDKFYHAIDDTINPEQNLVIARAQEGDESHFLNGKYLLPITDPLVKGALLRAEKTGRIFEATKGVNRLKTKAVNGKSEFGQDDGNKAILLDVAEPYAQMLSHLRGYNYGYMWFLEPESLERMGVDGNFVEVRCVHLNPFAKTKIFPGGRCYDDNYYIYDNTVAANIQFNLYAWVRGVRGAREFSTEDKVVNLDEKVSALIREMCGVENIP
ncbi:MAG: hypothetical protein KAT43_03620 [Nanoarchaeota archaeon]|nr:hypothetical protein [Nanoarchaeota archaeon]